MHERGRLIEQFFFFCFGIGADVTDVALPAVKVAEGTAKRDLEWLAGGGLPPGWSAVAAWPTGPEFAFAPFVTIPELASVLFPLAGGPAALRAARRL